MGRVATSFTPVVRKRGPALKSIAQPRHRPICLMSGWSPSGGMLRNSCHGTMLYMLCIYIHTIEKVYHPRFAILQHSRRVVWIARLNDYPWLKYVLIGSMGFFVSGTHEEGGSFRAVQLEVLKGSWTSRFKRQIFGEGGHLMACTKCAWFAIWGDHWKRITLCRWVEFDDQRWRQKGRVAVVRPRI